MRLLLQAELHGVERCMRYCRILRERQAAAQAAVLQTMGIAPEDIYVQVQSMLTLSCTCHARLQAYTRPAASSSPSARIGAGIRQRMTPSSAGTIGWCAEAQLHDHTRHPAKQHLAGHSWNPLSQGAVRLTCSCTGMPINALKSTCYL